MVARARVRTVLVLVALVGGATGCGDDGTGRAEESPSAGQSSPSQSASSTESQSPSESPSSEAPSPSPSETVPTAPASTGLARLLSGRQMPGFNESFRWRVASTKRGEGRAPFGTCHRFAMTSIGAEEVAVRRFVPVGPAEGSSASHLLADFADEKTAKRVYAVLTSWRAQCRDRLRRFDRVELGGLQTVDLSAGARSGGNWYLLTYGPPPGDPDAGYFDAQGITRVGDTISVLQMRLVGQDFNYLPGEEPMVAAVQTAAAKLGA